MVTHVVLFELEDRSVQRVEEAAAVLRSMAGRIPSLRGLEVGVCERKTGRSYDIALVTRFDSWEGYEAYRDHPYHQDPVLRHMHAVAAKAAVVDYESTEVVLDEVRRAG